MESRSHGVTADFSIAISISTANRQKRTTRRSSLQLWNLTFDEKWRVGLRPDRIKNAAVDPKIFPTFLLSYLPTFLPSYFPTFLLSYFPTYHLSHQPDQAPSVCYTKTIVLAFLELQHR